MSMYATVADVKARIGGANYVDADMVQSWIDACEDALYSEIKRSGQDADEVMDAMESVTNNCIVTMVINQLDINVGGDYSDSMTLGTYWDKSPKVPDTYKRAFGINRMRCAAMPCQA